MNSSCIEKIKKLLSLANSDNPHERDNALAKAQRIATENEVDLALLDLSDVGVIKEEALCEDEVIIGKRLEVHKKFVARIVKTVCSVEILYGQVYVENGSEQHVKTGVCGRLQTLSFLGKKHDVEFAKWLYPFLLDEYVRRWNYERKAHNLPLGHRNTFFLGVRDGQEQKIRLERQSAQRESISRHADVSAPEAHLDPIARQAKVGELTQKYTLAVQGEETRRKNFLKEKYPHTTNMRSTRVSICSHDTYSSGTSHGRAIGLNRPLN